MVHAPGGGNSGPDQLMASTVAESPSCPRMNPACRERNSTVVYGLPRNSEFLRQLSQELKRACGAGGTVVEGGIEIQGDQRETVARILSEAGFRPVFAGG